MSHTKMNNKIINICIILEKLKTKNIFVIKVYKNCTTWNSNDLWIH